MSLLIIKVGVGPIQGVLRQWRQKLADMTPAMRLIGNVVMGSVIENFEAGSSPEGQPWKQSKRVLKHGGQTLVDTGALKNSVGMEASANQVAIFESREYAAIHQEGGIIKRAARQSTLHFKTYSRGPRAGRTLFARPSQASRSILANVGSHTITMPARPSLGVKERDWPEIKRLLLGMLDA